jgi:hypothetical protein
VHIDFAYLKSFLQKQFIITVATTGTTTIVSITVKNVTFQWLSPIPEFEFHSQQMH